MSNCIKFSTAPDQALTGIIKQVLITFFVTVMMYPSSSGQNTEKLQAESLKEPRILTMDNQKMLVVEAKGDPNVIGSRAFSLLFQLFYRMKETPKGPMQSIPRARWPVSLDAPKSEWTGLYALPVPESVTGLPQFEGQEGLTATITMWEYGEIAEILHAGPYDSEEPTIEKLKQFIKERGYVIVDGHEEEYIKGPVMNNKGDPEKYLTIIRYRVQKSGKDK